MRCSTTATSLGDHVGCAFADRRPALLMSQGEGRSQRTVVTKRNIQVSSTASVAIIGSPIPRAKLICQPKHTGEDRSSISALGWCRMIGGLWVGVILSEHHARAA